jgi:cell fate regulator YaaT (PSP1 superfamily)
MSCSSCSTGGGAPGGCKNNGTCGTSGCNKLTVFDWLANMELPEGQAAFNHVEIRFKNSRKEFFQNPDNLQLKIGDVVATQAQSGHDIGIITLTGELVRVQMKRKRAKPTEDEFLKVYRIASQNDVDKWVESRDREDAMKIRAREIAIRLHLKMKISDIEFQGDGSKATIYYTAEDRVDFRELIREYAGEFRTRIEMRQIGLRQEAARLGGIGSCGRELCCSTWLSDFRTVTTSAARYQNLSLNPQKLAGQCGKLKCCLNYELDSYMDALSNFPKQTQKLYTTKGVALCQKVDIFKGLMWYCYDGEWTNWHTLTTDQVHEIVSKNKAKEDVPGIETYAIQQVVEEERSFENVVGQDSLTRFDQSQQTKNKRKKKRNTHKSPETPAGQKPAEAATNKRSHNKAGTAKGDHPRKPRPPKTKDTPDADTGNTPQKATPNQEPGKAAPSSRKRPSKKRNNKPRPKGDNNHPNNNNTPKKDS